MYKLGVFLLESEDVQIEDERNMNNMYNNNVMNDNTNINTK